MICDAPERVSMVMDADDIVKAAPVIDITAHRAARPGNRLRAPALIISPTRARPIDDELISERLFHAITL